MDDTTRQLEQHYTQIGPLLLAYFRQQRLLAGAADDLLQETFVRALRQRERLRRAVSQRAYLFGIARHVSLDALRRQRPVEALPETLAAEAPATEDPRLVVMRTAIAKLPDIHREPLLLKLQQELSYEEIAEALDIPVGTVRSRLHYAVAALENLLNPAGNPSGQNPHPHP